MDQQDTQRTQQYKDKAGQLNRRHAVSKEEQTQQRRHQGHQQQDDLDQPDGIAAQVVVVDDVNESLAQAGEEELIQRVKADYDRTCQTIRAYQEGVEA